MSVKPQPNTGVQSRETSNNSTPEHMFFPFQIFCILSCYLVFEI